MLHFIGIGAQKAGTTWLFERLNELPDFDFTPIKELHYFDRDSKYPSPNYLQEVSLYNRLKNREWRESTYKTLHNLFKNRNWGHFKWYWNYYYSNYNKRWYNSLFKSLSGISGEITPAYSMLDEESIREMKDFAPKAKIIFIIRNPIDRAWSHLRYNIKEGYIKENIDDISLESQKQFLLSKQQKWRSDYLSTIEKFQKHFGNKQFLVCFYDAISENPEGLLNDIVHFLGGNTSNIHKYCKIRAKSNISPQKNIPDEIWSFLKDMYKDDITKLRNLLGSYCDKWYAEINNTRLASDDFSPTTRLK